MSPIKNKTEKSRGAERSPWRHLPNMLSAFRIALIPVIFWLSFVDEHLWALIAFCVGASTDFADGWLAHRYQWQTHFGSLLDPVADRLYILCLIPLLWQYGAINGIYTTLVIARFSIQLSAFPVLLWWLKKKVFAKPEWLSRSAMGIAFLVLGMGFTEQVAIEIFYDSSGTRVIFEHTIDALTVIGGILEVWVLIRFVPRYWDVIRGRADTFE